MLFDRGVIAQEPHRCVLVGCQLRKYHQVTDARLSGQIGEAPSSSGAACTAW